MSGMLLNSGAKPVELGKYTLSEDKLKDPNEKWAIVQEVGIGYWFGRITELDEDKRVLTLHPGLVLPSIPRIPIAVMDPGGAIEGVVTGADMRAVLGRKSFHPIRSMAYSHLEMAHEFDQDLRHFCFLMVSLAVGAIRPEDAQRELSPRVQTSSTGRGIIPQ